MNRLVPNLRRIVVSLQGRIVPPHPSPVAQLKLLPGVGFAEDCLHFDSGLAGDEATDFIERFVGSGSRVASQDSCQEDRQSEHYLSFHSSFLSLEVEPAKRSPVRGDQSLRSKTWRRLGARDRRHPPLGRPSRL